MKDLAVSPSVSSKLTGKRILLDGQQRITSLTAVIKGKPIQVRYRQRPIDILFNLEHKEGPPAEVLEVEVPTTIVKMKKKYRVLIDQELKR